MCSARRWLSGTPVEGEQTEFIFILIEGLVGADHVDRLRLDPRGVLGCSSWLILGCVSLPRGHDDGAAATRGGNATANH